MPSKPVLLKFKIEGFEGLPLGPEKCTRSEQVTDYRGNAWQLKLYASGARVEDESWVSVYIEMKSPKEVRAKYAFVLRNERGEVFKEKRGATIFFTSGGAWGFTKFLPRSVILDKKNNILVDGALLLDVELQYKEESSIHKHSCSLSKKMLQLLKNEEHADIAFDVGGTRFTAHRNILSLNAPVLFSFCEGNDDGSPVPINDIAPKIFRILLRYVYGEEIPDTESMLDDGKDIIDASNKYAVTGLKLAVEAVLVESSIFTVDNVSDWLIFSDSKMCPLLKEQATAYFTIRSHDILNSTYSDQLKESPKLLTELLMETSNRSMDDRFGDARNTSVDELRKQLSDRGLEIDGSKEMLVARLRESKKRKRDE